MEKLELGKVLYQYFPIRRNSTIRDSIVQNIYGNTRQAIIQWKMFPIHEIAPNFCDDLVLSFYDTLSVASNDGGTMKR